MGYRFYHKDNMDRGYSVEDVCNKEGCNKKIDRGLGYLCYSCTKYFCGEHLTYSDEEYECFAGSSHQVCEECAKIIY